ncbi:hypothetical protein CLM82_00600, partial [Streptomyces albidoflavus]
MTKRNTVPYGRNRTAFRFQGSRDQWHHQPEPPAPHGPLDHRDPRRGPAQGGSPPGGRSRVRASPGQRRTASATIRVRSSSWTRPHPAARSRAPRRLHPRRPAPR